MTRKLGKEQPIAFTPEGKPIYGLNDEGQPVCFARLRNKTDRRCMRTQTMRNGRCRIHGGKSLKGAAHPQAKHLQYSRLLPKTMRKYLKVVHDLAAGTDLSNELDALRVREIHLLKLLNSRENDVTMREIEAAFQQVQNALKQGDRDTIENALLELGKVIEAGASNQAVWTEIRAVIRDIARVASVENRRRAIDSSMLSIFVVRDINFKAVQILRGAVVNNVEVMGEDLISDIRLSLIEMQIPPETIEVVSKLIVERVREHMAKIRDRILDESANGIASLHPEISRDAEVYENPEPRLLPSGNGFVS